MFFFFPSARAKSIPLAKKKRKKAPRRWNGVTAENAYRERQKSEASPNRTTIRRTTLMGLPAVEKDPSRITFPFMAVLFVNYKSVLATPGGKIDGNFLIYALSNSIYLFHCSDFARPCSRWSRCQKAIGKSIPSMTSQALFQLEPLSH